MKAVVTGGAGFIGSHLVEHLLANQHYVTVLDDISTGRMDNLGSVLGHPRLRVERGSILEALTVDQCIEDADAVFHLAAAVGTFTIRDRPMESIRTNIYGTENVLDSARRHSARVLVASTSEIYGMNTKIGLTEDDLRIMGSPIHSRWSYSDAKAIDETMTRSYFVENGVNSVIVRLFNTVGSRQSGRYGMVIPRFVAQALAGEPLTVFGNGQQIRCFCHVLDVVPALCALLDDEDAHGKIFNLGGTEPVTIESLAHRVIIATNSGSIIVHVPHEEAFYPGFQDVECRVPDCSRARRQIGFMPYRSLEDTIGDIIQHQLNRHDSVAQLADTVRNRGVEF
jgi:nucleoside-diphosphate-sugar epimerase